jgi:sarcosine oxidase subunit alpha
MTSIDFEGTPVEVAESDTIASALYRTGVRTFTRSLKYHRRRGLYCLSGDCPNCLMTVDDVPGVRACMAEACGDQRVRRESGFPSTERDLLTITDKVHRLMPVGFYYKTFTKPRWLWPLVERVIRRHTGVGTLPVDRLPNLKDTRYAHPDVLVIGGGVAGLSAARTATESGASVLLADEGRFAAAIPAGPLRERIEALAAELVTVPTVELLEQHVAVGIYEGPTVPLVGPDELVEVEPGRVIVATGAMESHGVFPGNDLPGVWLGRGAARLAGVHGVAPGRWGVAVLETLEGLEHLSILRAAGMRIDEVVAPDAIADLVPAGIPVTRNGRLLAAQGKGRVESVVLGTARGERTVACDSVVLSLGYAPRDGLLRMGDDLPITGAGDVVTPGCTLDQAAASGARAGSSAGMADERNDPVQPPLGSGGYVCLCEDVGVSELQAAWDEGWTNAEILKRYTTATMGPCQGAMCGRHLAAFVQGQGGTAQAGARTTARPPARTVRLEDLAGGVNEVIEKRTALHDAHLSAGAVLDWSGSWKRPTTYGDVAGEIRATREHVGLMDVGTLGKFLVGGPGAHQLMDRLFPCRVDDLEPGRVRYVLALDEAGYVIDDGLICALEGASYYLTSTSGGADKMEAWLRNWADRWDMPAHVMSQTAMLGAINVAGPKARELLQRLSDDDLGPSALGYSRHAGLTVAGIPCRAIRAGFVGEVSFELHHPRSKGVALWDALLEAGEDLDVRPHGLDALDVLRLEKGHIYVGQDTLPDDHPAKLGLRWTVAMDKPAFVGKVALERMEAFPLERRLVGLDFADEPQRGAPLHVGDRVVGRVTSCARSEALGRWIGLAWLRSMEGVFPTRVRAGRIDATVVDTPFYDPEGAKLRA